MAVAFSITAVFASFLPRIQVQKTIDIFYDKTSKTYRDFEVWKEQFGSDDRIIVAWKVDPSVFSSKGIKQVQEVTQALEALDFVDEVKSLSTVSDIWGEGEDFYAQPPFGEDVEITDLEKVKERVLANPILARNFVSPDGKTASCIVFLSTSAQEDKLKVIPKVYEVVDKLLGRGNYYLSGSAVVDYFYTRYMEEDLKVFLPLILLLILIILFLTFGNVGGILFPFLTIVMSLIWSLALLYIFKFPMNNVTTIIPPVIVAISIADSIHFVAELLQRHRREGLPVDRTLISRTVRHIFKPCLLTSVTTAIGFASLSVSRIVPVKQMGIVSAIGVLFALVITFTVLPALLELFPALLDKQIIRVSRRGNGFDRLLEAIARFDWGYRGWILSLAGVLVILSIWGAFRIRTETIMINYFKKDTEVYKSTVFIQDNLGGIHFVNVSLRAKDPSTFKDPEVLERLERLEAFARDLPKVDKVITVNEYLKLMNKALHGDDPAYYRLPEKRSTIEQYLLLYDIEDMQDFVNEDWNWVNVQVRTSENSSLGLMRLIDQIREKAQEEFSGSDVEVSVVGRSVLEAETNQLVTQGQIQSLGLAFLLIFLLMFVVFRSWKVGLLSMFPNVLPLVFNFGIMGWLGIRLDSATSMISAVGIGIIVDDTIHFLHSLIEHRRTMDLKSAVRAVLLEKGRPIVFTSVILFCGFVILVTSRFSPTSAFGMLTSVLMISALIADIVIFPAFLYVLSDKRGGGRP